MANTKLRRNSDNIEERLTTIMRQARNNLVHRNYDMGRALIPFLFLRRLDCILLPYNAEVKNLYLNLSKKTPEANLDYLIRGAVKGHYFYNVSGLSLTSLLGDTNSFDEMFNRYIIGFNNIVKDILNLFDFDRIVADLRN